MSLTFKNVVVPFPNTKLSPERKLSGLKDKLIFLRRHITHNVKMINMFKEKAMKLQRGSVFRRIYSQYKASEKQKSEIHAPETTKNITSSVTSIAMEEHSLKSHEVFLYVMDKDFVGFLRNQQKDKKSDVTAELVSLVDQYTKILMELKQYQSELLEIAKKVIAFKEGK